MSFCTIDFVGEYSVNTLFFGAVNLNILILCLESDVSLILVSHIGLAICDTSVEELGFNSSQIYVSRLRHWRVTQRCTVSWRQKKWDYYIIITVYISAFVPKFQLHLCGHYDGIRIQNLGCLYLGRRHFKSEVMKPRRRELFRYLLAAIRDVLIFTCGSLSAFVLSPWQRDERHRNESSQRWWGSAYKECPSKDKTL